MKFSSLLNSLSLLAFAQFTGSAAASPSEVLSFGTQKTLEVRWTPLTDQVRGGRSTIAISDISATTSLISGTLTLMDGAGFSSIRATKLSPPLTWNFATGTDLVLRVKGDGRLYRLLLKDRSSVEKNVSYAFEAPFETSGEWQELRLPLASFQAYRRGHAWPTAAPLRLNEIGQIGLQINDKREAPFALEIESVRLE